ncbi:MAG: rRNA pseudouridine synthase [Coriobacteriia bacterium]|nr:rRNA pseudouridine synthase [Coriobacteriia bacterium]
MLSMRLQKFLARSGVASRRGSEDLMTAGRVSVNGETVTELGSKIDPDIDVICLDGKKIELVDNSIYLMLNKPTGVVSTMIDPYERPTVSDYVPTKEYPGLFPVGRLDFDTTGLLLFMTDGELSHRLLHPKWKVNKAYRATVDGQFAEEDADKLREGVTLDDGPTARAHVEIIETMRTSSVVDITISEGRKRQVRRMFSFVHHSALALTRMRFADIELGNLPQGRWRLLSDGEVRHLKELVGYTKDSL